MVDAVEELKASVSQNWQLTAIADGRRVAGARWPLEWGLWIFALLWEARGDTDQALALLKEAWELAAPLRFCLSYRFLAPDLVRLAVAAGDRELAQRVAQEVAGELGVARLAAEGLTNPQIGDRLFISRRTVATHLASVFRKLGITNRVQLATEVSRIPR